MNDVYDWDEELDEDEDPCNDCPYYEISGDICLRVQQGKNCYYIDESIRIMSNMKKAYEEVFLNADNKRTQINDSTATQKNCME